MPKFTIPFTGQYNSRIAKSNAASGASGVIGVGIVGVFIVGASSQASDKDERYVNCFLTNMGGRNYIIKRPGFASLNTPSSGNVGSAILVWTGNGAGTAVITAFGATNSTLYSGTSSLGAITGKATGITETFITTTPTLAVSSSDNTGWYYDTGVAVMTKITDGDFPGNAGFTLAGTFAHLKGFACIMSTDGKLWAGDLNSITAWTANSFDANNSYPDRGVGCVRQGDYIMAFGSESIQFWQDAGLTPFPLQCVTSKTVKVGAVSADAIASLADTVFWAGATDKGGLSVFQYDGAGLNRISTPEQDFQLAIAGPSNISLSTLRVYGRSFVLVKANTTTYIYVVEDKKWHEWTSTTPLWYKCAGLSMGTQVLTYSISNIDTSGKVFIINPASLVFTDNSVAYTATFQAADDDGGAPGQLKFYEQLVAAADQEPTTSALTVSKSDDDFQTFDVVGTMDLSLPSPRLGQLGSSYSRAWRFTHSANTAMRVQAMYGRLSVGN